MGNKRTGYIDSRRIFGERSIQGIPVAGGDQDYEAASVLQNWQLGTRMTENGKVFYYAKAGGTLIPDQGAKINYVQAVAFAAVANAVVGATSVVITVGAGDGIAANGNIAADELVGGEIVLYPAGAQSHMTRRITSNTVVVGGGAMTVGLDRPLSTALTGAASNGECMHSLYLAVINDNSNIHRVAGIAPIAATINQYIWLQTWGPAWLSPQATVGVGFNSDVVFREDGSLSIADPAAPVYNTKLQRAGYVLRPGTAGGAQGAPFIMLEIRP